MHQQLNSDESWLLSAALSITDIVKQPGSSIIRRHKRLSSCQNRHSLEIKHSEYLPTCLSVSTSSSFFFFYIPMLSVFLPFNSLHLFYSLLFSLFKALHVPVCLSLPLTVFCSTAFIFLQCWSHWVHIYNLAFHFMASGNGCFTAFIKACSSQRCVFPLKFSSMNLAIRGHYGLRFQVTVEHCII